MKRLDVVIIGAGAAGLACAAELQSHGKTFKILEARNRIGGRMWSHVTPDPVVLEYGAEFIHGAHREVLDIMRDTHSPFVDLCDEHLFKQGSSMQELPRFWEDFDKVHSLLNKDLVQDRSMNAFLEAHAGRITPTLKRLYTSYIEGFQAADMELAGERGMAVAEAGGEDPELNSQSQFRPLSGYTSVLDRFVKLHQLRKHVVLNSVVRRVLHDDDGVMVEVRAARGPRLKKYRARRIVVTVPIGVLKAAAMEFVPALPELERGLASLHMGHVQRMSFQFRERFWENLSEKPVGFLHAGPEHYFPTWWTQMPLRSPYLIAWQGGPKAFEMGSWPENERVDAALATLAYLTNRTKSFLQKNYVKHFTHNWSRDPLAFGAYSYVGIQNDHGSASLKSALGPGKNIFLAGEGVAEGAARGTVMGALRSGREVARKIARR